MTEPSKRIRIEMETKTRQKSGFERLSPQLLGMLTGFFDTIQEFHCFEELCVATSKAMYEHSPRYMPFEMKVDDDEGIAHGVTDLSSSIFDYQFLWEFMPLVSERLARLDVWLKMLPYVVQVHSGRQGLTMKPFPQLQTLVVYSKGGAPWNGVELDYLNAVLDASAPTLTSLELRGVGLSNGVQTQVLRKKLPHLTELTLDGNGPWWDGATSAEIDVGLFDGCLKSLTTLSVNLSPSLKLGMGTDDMAATRLDRFQQSLIKYRNIVRLHLDIGPVFHRAPFAIRLLEPVASTLEELWLVSTLDTTVSSANMKDIVQALAPFEALRIFGFTNPVKVCAYEHVTLSLAMLLEAHPKLTRLRFHANTGVHIGSLLADTKNCAPDVNLDVKNIQTMMHCTIPTKDVVAWYKNHRQSRAWLLDQVVPSGKNNVSIVINDNDDVVQLTKLPETHEPSRSDTSIYLDIEHKVDAEFKWGFSVTELLASPTKEDDADLSTDTIKDDKLSERLPWTDICSTTTVPTTTRPKWTSLAALVAASPTRRITIHDASNYIDFSGIDGKAPFLKDSSDLELRMQVGRSFFRRPIIESLCLTGGTTRLIVTVRQDVIQGLRLVSLFTGFEAPINNCPIHVTMTGDCDRAFVDGDDVRILQDFCNKCSNSVVFTFLPPLYGKYETIRGKS